MENSNISANSGSLSLQQLEALNKMNSSRDVSEYKSFIPIWNELSPKKKEEILPHIPTESLFFLVMSEPKGSEMKKKIINVLDSKSQNEISKVLVNFFCLEPSTTASENFFSMLHDDFFEKLPAKTLMDLILYSKSAYRERVKNRLLEQGEDEICKAITRLNDPSSQAGAIKKLFEDRPNLYEKIDQIWAKYILEDDSDSD